MVREPQVILRLFVKKQTVVNPMRLLLCHLLSTLSNVYTHIHKQLMQTMQFQTSFFYLQIYKHLMNKYLHGWDDIHVSLMEVENTVHFSGERPPSGNFYFHQIFSFVSVSHIHANLTHNTGITQNIFNCRLIFQCCVSVHNNKQPW